MPFFEQISVQSVKHMITGQNSNNQSKGQSRDTSNLVRTKRKVRTVAQAIFKGEVAARALSPRINSGKASLSACGPAAKATNDANKCQDIWNQIFIVGILIQEQNCCKPCPKFTYSSRGDIYHSHHCRRQCKIFASGVNFSTFIQFLCFQMRQHLLKPCWTLSD